MNNKVDLETRIHFRDWLWEELRRLTLYFEYGTRRPDLAIKRPSASDWLREELRRLDHEALQTTKAYFEVIRTFADWLSAQFPHIDCVVRRARSVEFRFTCAQADLQAQVAISCARYRMVGSYQTQKLVAEILLPRMVSADYLISC